MRITLPVLVFLAGAAGTALPPSAATAAPRKPAKPAKPAAKTPEQKEADRHFKSGVALFKEAKYAEALAEFERANELAPHPLVLYNIAGCHRELSHYSEAVTYYRRFLAEGPGKVPDARLTAAQSELDGILARIARVTVTVKPALNDVTLIIDGTPLDKVEMPLILPPGEHRVVVHAAGHQDSERSVRVASGDQIAVDLALAELPPPPTTPAAGPAVEAIPPERPEPAVPARPRRFALGAGFGMDLRRTRDSGAPSLDFGMALGSRLAVGIDVVFVAFAAVPSIRVRLAGDALSLHAIGAVPVSFNDGSTMKTFAAVAGGLGLRYRPSPGLAFRLDSFVSYAGKTHGTTVPTFLGGELWF